MWNSSSRLAELREAAGTDDWEDVLVLYCERQKEKDFKIARMINTICDKLEAQIEDHRMLAQELDNYGWVIIKEKTSEFLKDQADKDDERLQGLRFQALESQERAHEKLHFIDKLKGFLPF